MLKKITLSLHNKKLSMEAKKTNIFSRFSGLMFKSSNTKNLLFDFKRDVNYSIHSFFVFFKFLAVWLDSDGKIIEYRIISPFCHSARPKKCFKKLIEIPLNKQNKHIIGLFRR